MWESVRKEGGKVAAKREQEGKANKRKSQGLRVPTYSVYHCSHKSAALFNTFPIQ